MAHSYNTFLTSQIVNAIIPCKHKMHIYLFSLITCLTHWITSKDIASQLQTRWYKYKQIKQFNYKCSKASSIWEINFEGIYIMSANLWRIFGLFLCPNLTKRYTPYNQSHTWVTMIRLLFNLMESSN